MIITSQDLALQESSQFVDDYVYLNEFESAYKPIMVPVVENTRLGTGIVSHTDIERLSDSYGCTYDDALSLIAESNNLMEDSLTVAIDEADLILDPYITSFYENSVIKPISDYEPTAIGIDYLFESSNIEEGLAEDVLLGEYTDVVNKITGSALLQLFIQENGYFPDDYEIDEIVTNFLEETLLEGSFNNMSQDTSMSTSATFSDTPLKKDRNGKWIDSFGNVVPNKDVEVKNGKGYKKSSMTPEQRQAANSTTISYGGGKDITGYSALKKEYERSLITQYLKQQGGEQLTRDEMLDISNNIDKYKVNNKISGKGAIYYKAFSQINKEIKKDIEEYKKKFPGASDQQIMLHIIRDKDKNLYNRYQDTDKPFKTSTDKAKEKVGKITKDAPWGKFTKQMNEWQDQMRAFRDQYPKKDEWKNLEKTDPAKYKQIKDLSDKMQRIRDLVKAAGYDPDKFRAENDPKQPTPADQKPEEGAKTPAETADPTVEAQKIQNTKDPNIIARAIAALRKKYRNFMLQNKDNKNAPWYKRWVAKILSWIDRLTSRLQYLTDRRKGSEMSEEDKAGYRNDEFRYNRTYDRLK